MKKILYSAVCLFLLHCTSKTGDGNFEVNGTVKNSGAQTIYLEEAGINGNPVILDSAKLGKDGSFELTTLANGENIFSLRLNSQRFPFVSVINDSKEVTITADLNTAEDYYTVKGSEASSQLKDFLKELVSKINGAVLHKNAIDSLSLSAKADSLVQVKRNELKTHSSDLKQYVVGFVDKSKSPSLALFALGTYDGYSRNPQLNIEPFSQKEIKELVQKAATRFPDHKGLTQVANQLAQSNTPPAEMPKEVKPAPDFTLPDVAGKPVSLSSYKGKYVLVDFWASWCRPCRMENPNVVAAYNKFKDKNFTILGVSLDKEKAAWLQAIQQDNLTWTHVSDLKFWDSMVVPLYGIDGIPYNVLVDPNGNVIASRLTGEQLEETLRRVLK